MKLWLSRWGCFFGLVMMMSWSGTISLAETEPLAKPTAQGKPADQIFVKKFLAQLWLDGQLKTKQHPIYKIAQSPWAPFVKPTYRYHLPLEEQKKFKQAVANLSCQSLIDYEQKGFLMAFPQLKPVFEHQLIFDQFKQLVLPMTSYPVIYCLAENQLEKRPNRYVRMEDFWPKEQLKPKVLKHVKAIENLMLLDGCGDYEPAQRLLLAISDEKGSFGWSIKSRAQLLYHLQQKNKAPDQWLLAEWKKLQGKPVFQRLNKEDYQTRPKCEYKNWQWLRLHLFSLSE